MPSPVHCDDEEFVTLFVVCSNKDVAWSRHAALDDDAVVDFTFSATVCVGVISVEERSGNVLSSMLVVVLF